MDESSDLPLIPVGAEASATDLSGARSITLIIHGVGNSSNERLLKPASDGYIRSELGGVSKRTLLTNCPTLTGGMGAESLVIREPGGSHFVVALPWAERRTRLSAIAKWCAGLLLALTVLMSITFLFRGPLEWLEQWLRSWTHRFIAYGVMNGLSFVVYLLRPNPTKRGFKSPSMWYLFLPPLLLLGLTLFIGFDELFWIPVALLVFSLWGMATMIVLRCVAIAPTAGWKIALLALVVSITMPSAVVVRIAKQRAIHTENLYPSPDSPFAHIELLPPPLPEGAPDSLLKMPVNTRSQKAPIRERAASAPNGSVADTITPSGNDSQGSVADLRAQEEVIDRELSDPDRSRAVRSSPKLPNIVDLVTAREFAARVALAGICIVLSGGLMAFHWVLDFGFDVLHYGGNERFRSSLIQATIKTIRWFHEQAPNTPIILVGHSLGSVVAGQTLASLCATESWLSRVVLVTLGSPLNYISRAFPKSVPPARKLADAICAAGVRWINLWRLSDPIGKFLDIGESGTVQDCVDKGGHMDYWSRAAVWQAVAFRALGIGEGSPEAAISGAKACVLERSLGLLVFCSIILLWACGIGLWLLPL
jgi:hypothetical protein